MSREPENRETRRLSRRAALRAGAALGAARMLNSGDPRGEAVNIFKSNFPAGYMGVSSVTDPTSAANFFNLTTNSATGVNIVTVQASAILPTTFMQLANFQQVTVGAASEIWPPGSGNIQSFPEIDRVEFFSIPEARKKLKESQHPFLDRLQAALKDR